MVTVIERLPDHVIGIRIDDKLRAEDYEKQLVPLVNELLQNQRKRDLLCCIEGEWKGNAGHPFPSGHDAGDAPWIPA